MIELFHGSDETTHNAFQEWRASHPDGFHLSEKTKGRFVAHWTQDKRENPSGRGCIHQGCSWIAYLEDKNACYTTKRKVCSVNLHELLAWAGKNDAVFKACSRCDTEANPFPTMDAPVPAPGPAPVPSQVELAAFRAEFNEKVEVSLRSSHAARLERLRSAPSFPSRIVVQSSQFVRNPDVVAEVLLRSSGRCEKCSSAAPFRRSSDGTPYLEVHHRVPLSAGGEDTVDNSTAVCPNCHRRLHHGSPSA